MGRRGACSLLEVFFLPFGEQICSETCILQFFYIKTDNCTTKRLYNHSIHVVVWSPESLDLNSHSPVGSGPPDHVGVVLERVPPASLPMMYVRLQQALASPALSA